jgi:hypothetical protein
MENVLTRHITDLQNICVTSSKNITGIILDRSQTWQFLYSSFRKEIIKYILCCFFSAFLTNVYSWKRCPHHIITSNTSTGIISRMGSYKTVITLVKSEYSNTRASCINGWCYSTHIFCRSVICLVRTFSIQC